MLLVSSGLETYSWRILTMYSGDMLNPKKKYNLEYYVSVVDKIVAMGAHVLGIKDSKPPIPETRDEADKIQWPVFSSLVLPDFSLALFARSTLTFPSTSTLTTPPEPV